jgi:Tol biopolymer transport system component
LPRWSPDSKRIAFQALAPGKSWKMYLISTDGGAPQEVLPGFGDVGWSEGILWSSLIRRAYWTPQLRASLLSTSWI